MTLIFTDLWADRGRLNQMGVAGWCWWPWPPLLVSKLAVLARSRLGGFVLLILPCGLASLMVLMDLEEVKSNHAYVFQALFASCLLVSHWPKQVTWLRLEFGQGFTLSPQKPL